MLPLKKFAIDLLQIAERNLLNSIRGIRKEDVYKQPIEEFNNISWIFGHCAVHFHMVLCDTCQDLQLLSGEVIHYYRYGTTKEEIMETGPPHTFSELVDEYLRISDAGFAYLSQLDDDDFQKVIFPEIEETLLMSAQRIALHYMGHVGQIVLIRNALGTPGPTFVGGINSKERDRMKKEWESWWSETKRIFETEV